MRAAQLRDRVVAVAEEDPLVESPGPLALLAVERLQRMYGYYLDKNLWNDLADLFAKDSSMELAQRGSDAARKRVVAGRITAAISVISANTGRSRFVKCGARSARSSSLKVSTG